MKLKMKPTFFVCIATLVWVTPVLLSVTNGLGSQEKNSCFWLCVNFFGTGVLMGRVIRRQHSDFYFGTFLTWILFALITVCQCDNVAAQLLVLAAATVDVMLILPLYLDLLDMQIPECIDFLQPLFFPTYLYYTHRMGPDVM